VNNHKTTAYFFRISILLAAFCAFRASADVVETTNGARIVGKITKIHEGVVTINTDFAGDIDIKQALVTKITTDHPVGVRVSDGTRYIGAVVPAPGGGLQVTTKSGAVETPVSKVVAWWAAGEEDPDVVALRRKWSYALGVDITGQTGTQSQMGTEANYRAKLTGPNDVFQYYADYLRQESEGAVSVDQLKIGVDYADNFTPLTSWYVRDEGGFDRVNDISFYDVAAGGYGYDFIKEKDAVLTGRAGLSYRYDRYAPADTPSQSLAGADFELQFSKKLGKAQINDRLEFVPAFEDLGNYIINHEFTYDIPITKSLWKLSVGVTNSYNSRPVAGVDTFETIYFTRLVLAWGQTPKN
jgi:putative salt-induced outer membrane protein YdiY